MNYSITGPAANVYPECTGVISEGAKWRICETKGKERRRTTVKQTRMSNLSKMELHSYISASINNLMSSLLYVQHVYWLLELLELLLLIHSIHVFIRSIRSENMTPTWLPDHPLCIMSSAHCVNLSLRIKTTISSPVPLSHPGCQLTQQPGKANLICSSNSYIHI